jgi:hypothetical protein
MGLDGQNPHGYYAWPTLKGSYYRAAHISVAGFDWRGTGAAIANIVFEKSNNKNEFS